MIVKKQLVDNIRNHFDLNVYETKVWLALLGKGIASASQISEISEVPRSRTYDVLESLEKKGFAIAKIGKPTRYIALKPKLVLEKLKRKENKKAEKRIKTLEKLEEEDEYKKLMKLHESSLNPIKREEISGSIKGNSSIASHAREILKEAEKSIGICLPAREILQKKIFDKFLKNLSKKNIKVRLALKGEDEDLEMVEKKYGIKPFKTDIESKFFIIDDEQILVYLTDSDNDDDIAIWLNSEFFTSAFSSFFEMAIGRE